MTRGVSVHVGHFMLIPLDLDKLNMGIRPSSISLHRLAAHTLSRKGSEPANVPCGAGEM